MLHNRASRATVIGLSVVVAAPFYSFGSGINLFVFHLVFPVLWGMSIGVWWLTAAWVYRLLSLVAIVLSAQILGTIFYSVMVGPQYAITSDVVALYLAAYSAATQSLVAIVGLFVTNIMVTRRARKHAA